MTSFTDNAGRTWTIAITVDAIKRVQALLGVNLADITATAQQGDGQGGGPLLTRLETDLVLLCDVIYAVVKPQADQQGVSDEQFGQALGGDAILAAHDAFWSALADFFRSLRRSDQVRAIEKQTALVHAAVEAADKRIEALDVDGLVERAMTDAAVPPGGGGGSSASSSPASSASTPAR